MVEIKEVFEVIGYFLLLDKQGGFFWLHGTVLLKRKNFLVSILTEEGHVRASRFFCYEKGSFFPQLHACKPCCHLLQLQSMEQGHSENLLKPFVASRASLMMSKGIYLAKASLIILETLSFSSNWKMLQRLHLRPRCFKCPVIEVQSL